MNKRNRRDVANSPIQPQPQPEMADNIDFSEKLSRLARHLEKPTVTAQIRSTPEDFRVEEQLSFQPSGSGEHLFLQIKKSNANTDWIAKQLQKTFALTSRELGYAGKKDRHAVSTQWFSLHLPGKEVDLDKLSAINMMGGKLKVISAVRHNKKLKIGSLKGNKFEIVLRQLSEPISQERIEKIQTHGVPNYFGSQRFGFDANNLRLADQYFTQQAAIKNRNLRGLVISSARSLLFNLILSKRIEDGSWCRAVPGDCLMLNASQSFFLLDGDPANEQSRIDSGDIHVSGLLPGREKSDASLAAEEFEAQVIRQFPKWTEAFYRLNLSTSRRAFRCMPNDLVVEQEKGRATLKFSLNKGCYATSVIRELVKATDFTLINKREAEKR